MVKICIKCKNTLSIDNFYKHKTSADGYRNQCKECIKVSKATFYADHKSSITLQKHQYYVKNKGKKLLYEKQYYQNNKHYRLKYLRNWRINNPNYINNSIQRRIAKNLRSRIYNAIRKKYKTSSAVQELGCSLHYLKLYLQKKFYRRYSDNEIMSWDNYGSSWHIDHIKPLSKFDLTNPKEFKEACHYSNLQPMWAIENIKKSNK